MIPHNRITWDSAETAAAAAAVQSGQWTCGPRVAALEQELARRAGVQHAVCVASGVSALRLALRALAIGPGAAVLVPAYSCVALANAVLACEGRPVCVDVEPGAWNLAPEAAEASRSTAPKAVIAVDTFGMPARIERLRRLGAPVIEDCAHAFGIQHEGGLLGGRADVGILSFHATKLIAAGEGGAVLTQSEAIAESVRAWRDYANRPPDGTRLNDSMTDIEAALALCQLERLDDMLEARRQIAARYDEALCPLAEASGAFHVPATPQARVWYRYAVEMTSASAEKVIDELAQNGIEAVRPVVDWRPADGPSCPVADAAYERVVSLPLYPTLSGDEQAEVIAQFRAVCEAIA